VLHVARNAVGTVFGQNLLELAAAVAVVAEGAGSARRLDVGGGVGRVAGRAVHLAVAVRLETGDGLDPFALDAVDV
jgi:hypothetical protein